MIGLIVSSMPSLPAFVRHLRGIAFSKSTLPIQFSRPDRGRDQPRMGLDDPNYSANSGYWELTDLEGQKELPTKRDGLEESVDNTTITVVGAVDKVR